MSDDEFQSPTSVCRSQERLHNWERPTTATIHILQNQRSTPHEVTHGLCSPADGHNDARNMLRQKLIINILLLHLDGFLSLHTLLTMHSHRNLKPTALLSSLSRASCIRYTQHYRKTSSNLPVKYCSSVSQNCPAVGSISAGSKAKKPVSKRRKVSTVLQKS